MKVSLEYRDAKSQKFWEGETRGRTLTVRFGKIGTAGQTKTQELANAAAAEAELVKKAASKTKKGYEEVRAAASATPATSTSAPSAITASAEAATSAPRKAPVEKAGPAVVPAPYPSMPAKALTGDVIRLSDYPRVFALSADGSTLAAHGIGSVHIVDVPSRTWTKSHKSGEAKDMVFLRDGLVVGSKTMHLIDPIAGKKRLSFKGHKAPANQLVLSSDGVTLWSGGGNFMDTHDRFLYAFDTQTGALRYKAKPGKGSGAMSMAVVDDVVAVAAEDGHVRTFSATDGQPRTEVVLAPAEALGTPFGGIAATRGGFVACFKEGEERAVVWLDTDLNIEAKITLPVEDAGPSIHRPMVGAGHIVIPFSGTNNFIAVIDEATRALVAIYAPSQLDDCRCCTYLGGLFAWKVREGVAIASLMGDAATKVPPQKSAEPVIAEAPVDASAPLPRGAMMAGGPRRQGAYAGDLKNRPRVQWARTAHYASGDEFGGWVVVGDGLAVGSNGGWLAAHDAKTGDTKWEIETSTSMSFATSGISIADGRVFMATNKGLHAYDATGAELWKARVAGAAGAPMVFEDVCVIGGKGGLHARSLDKKGRKAWVFEVKDRIRTAPAYADGLFYVYADTHLLAVALSTRRLAWSVPAAEPLCAGPVIANGYVIYMAGRGTLAAAECKTGKQVWTRDVDALVGSRFISASTDAVFLRDDGGRIQAYDLATGTSRWSSDGGRDKPYWIGSAGPIVVGETIVTITVEESTMPDTYLTGLDAASGDVLWDLDSQPVKKAIKEEQMREGSSFEGAFRWYGSPHVHDGVLYVQSDAGIVALK
ncbi:MAG: PQQ-binding-like beta-propeller repeat protein [Myxococcota bacterium]